jgi:hypothetical protein
MSLIVSSDERSVRVKSIDAELMTLFKRSMAFTRP